MPKGKEQKQKKGKLLWNCSRRTRNLFLFQNIFVEDITCYVKVHRLFWSLIYIYIYIYIYISVYIQYQLTKLIHKQFDK